jgi:GNAT superfamily N-acetyltransferase
MTIRPASREDLPAIIHLLADDPLGAKRERDVDPLPGSYYEAFDAIGAQPGQQVVVAEVDGRVAATLQLVVVPCITYQGSRRAHIEAVRVAADQRGQGLGAALVKWAIDEARAQGCRIVQLTSDRSRVDAHRFYERLGFKNTHYGLKLHLGAT